MCEIGHPVLNPKGKEIRIPAAAFKPLKRLGVLVRDQQTGLYRLTDGIYQFLKREFDPLTADPGKAGLRHLLGLECDGPELVDCDCKECRSLKNADEPGAPSPRRTVHNRFKAFTSGTE
jgi:hypothetical protein